MTLDGEPVETNVLTYEQLMRGGELHFALRPEPDFDRGTSPDARPYSLTRGEVVSIPYTTQSAHLFTEPVEIILATTTPGAEIRYTLDGSEPGPQSPRYTEPVRVDRSLTLRAKGFKAGAAPSHTLTLRAEKARFLPPAATEAATQGVRYTYYEGAVRPHGRHSRRPSDRYRRHARTFDRRRPAGRPFRLSVRRADPDSATRNLGVRHQERRRQRAADRRPQGRGQRRARTPRSRRPAA